MKKKNKYDYLFKNEFCPICNSELKIIAYGKINSELNDNKYIWGGCLYSKNNPKYFCTNCNKNFDINLKEQPLIKAIDELNK